MLTDALVSGRWLRSAIVAVAAVAVVPAAVGQYCETYSHAVPAPPVGPSAWVPVEYRTGAGEGRIAVVLEQNLYLGDLQLQAAIETFADDLDAEGHAVVAVLFNGTAEELRGQLQALYGQSASLSGAVFVGKVPYVLYEWEDDPNVGGRNDFPTDVFFMDLDGTWEKDHCTAPECSDEKYDYWDYSDPEIWVSRIKVDNLPGIKDGLRDAEVICAYLARNHEHRNPLTPVGAPDTPFRPSERAMLVDNHHSPALAEPFVGEAFANLESLCTSAATSTAYTAALTAANRYYFINYHGHGAPDAHELADGLFPVSAYRELQSPCTAIGFTFSSCHTCNFLWTDNLGGTVAFNPDAATLIVYGFTTTKACQHGEDVYTQVGLGRTFGESFKAAFSSSADKLAMVLLGDGTLKPDPHWWDGGDPSSDKWSEPLNWEDDTVPGSHQHVRIADASVEMDAGVVGYAEEVWSVVLRDGVDLEFKADKALAPSCGLVAEVPGESTVTMRSWSALATKWLGNVDVYMDPTPYGTTALLAHGGISNGSIVVNENCSVEAGRISNCDVVVAEGGALSADNAEYTSIVLGAGVEAVVGGTVRSSTCNVGEGGSLTIGRGQMCHFNVAEDASLVATQLGQCGGNVSAGAAVTVTTGISGEMSMGSVQDWVIDHGSVSANAIYPYGIWDLTAGTVETSILQAVGEYGYGVPIYLRDGSSVSVSSTGGGSAYQGTFPDAAGHELIYGAGANSFACGSVSAPLDRMYLGDQTRIRPVEGVAVPSLTLDLYGELHIASDFEQEFVYEGWDTRCVDITAHAVDACHDDVQVIELISPLFAQAGNAALFADVRCAGAFRDLTLPDTVSSAAPTAMRNLYENSEHGWPTATGWFEDVYVGDDRKLDFYEGEGAIHYSGDRVISRDGQVRYWADGAPSPMIVTLVSDPSLDELIIPAVRTLYGDWNGDCVISNMELAQLQAAIAGGSSTYDPLMDSNCDGVLSNVELAKFLDNMTVQPPCGGRDGGGGRGEGEGDDWASEEDGGAEDGDGAGERSGGEDGVDVAELAEWIVAELSPEELAVFVADLAAAATEFAGTRAGADMAALLAEFE
jgi:hypothetical protein